MSKQVFISLLHASAPAAVNVVEDDDDDEDVPDAIPILPPPALPIPVAEATVAVGVNSLYGLLFGQASGFMIGHYAAEVRMRIHNC